jgi:hypothetical protein
MFTVFMFTDRGQRDSRVGIEREGPREREDREREEREGGREGGREAGRGSSTWFGRKYSLFQAEKCCSTGGTGNCFRSQCRLAGSCGSAPMRPFPMCVWSDFRKQKTTEVVQNIRMSIDAFWSIQRRGKRIIISGRAIRLRYVDLRCGCHKGKSKKKLVFVFSCFKVYCWDREQSVHLVEGVEWSVS